MPASDILASIGRAAANLGLSGAPAKIWDELRPWMLRLAVNAAPKWLPVMALGVPCEIPIYRAGQPIGPCPGRAIGGCGVCLRSCCLNHACIDQHGEAICYLCVNDARMRARAAAPGAGAAPAPPGPSPEELRAARRKLGVSRDASWDEVQRAYRAKLAKHHPDRHQSPEAKVRAEEKFKEIRRAYDLLRSVHEAEEAAA